MLKDNISVPTFKATITHRERDPEFQALLLKAYRIMFTARTMSEKYEANRSICKYVHSTSAGHEAIQIAAGLQLRACDYVSPYYRDDSMMLAMGYAPQTLMMQLLGKAGDPFSGGRSYYCHPNSRQPGKPVIPHQSSATGMQVIPTTGMAQGVQYLENAGLLHDADNPVVLCSLGDGSVTEGEVSEALQFAVLKDLPIIYLVQDNEWGISVSAGEARVMDAFEYAAGFKGLERIRVDGSDFEASYHAMESAIRYVRSARKPVLVHATTPLLGHHTSGVRKEWYRSDEDYAKHLSRDPLPRLQQLLADQSDLRLIEEEVIREVNEAFEEAAGSADPDISTVKDHVFAPTPVAIEAGTRVPSGGSKVVMVDAALHAIEEIMRDHPESILFGQDVGRRLGGVFREAATLAEKFGDHRVFNTAIQEAYIIGSTVGLSAVGVKPIVEVQFADYIYPGFNQLVTEISKSCYLSMGKFPVQTLIRIPIGAYGGGGPYHSGCIESTLLTIKGIKICYPSNAADLKGLMKAAFLDPNPVIMLEHKGLYWSKVPGTLEAMTIEPSADYILPLGKGNTVLEANEGMTIITYGMGVYWAKAAAAKFPGRVEIIDLRTLYPLDEELVFASVRKLGKCLVLTEEQITNSFAESLAARISKACFRWLDAPVHTMGALDLPAVPLNMALEKEMLPTADKVADCVREILEF
ncbi:thiamine pyrophosphate-dependent enzyme [Chitinophaga sp. YIM B06452]|uniref:alpha-ketoacid dehydrogenase subunit alpha/beta n=1 Tax=Chitinophaga sp. YIM B06452 TaxID=3082158 RepID=UPI0031FF32E0